MAAYSLCMTGKRIDGYVVSYGDARGFGFIRAEDGTEYFVRFNEIQTEGYRTLRPGERVTFEPREAPGGQLQARAVSRYEDTQ